MRTGWILLGAGLAAGLLWALVLRDQDPGPALPEPGETTALRDELEANPHLLLRTGTLEIVAQAPDGSVPPGTEVGYLEEGGPRLRYADAKGRRVFSDATLGPITVIARAPGFQEARQERELLAGVRETVVLVLVPVRD